MKGAMKGAMKGSVKGAMELDAPVVEENAEPLAVAEPQLPFAFANRFKNRSALE